MGGGPAYNREEGGETIAQPLFPCPPYRLYGSLFRLRHPTGRTHRHPLDQLHPGHSDRRGGHLFRGCLLRHSQIGIEYGGSIPIFYSRTEITLFDLIRKDR